MTFEELVTTMVRHRVLRAKVITREPAHHQFAPGLGASTEFEVELHPLAFVDASAPADKAGPFPQDIADTKCNCGHPLTEHSEHGLCLQGCSTDVCGLGEKP